MRYFVISNRPDVFAATRQSVVRLLPFVDGFTVVVPDGLRGFYEINGDSTFVDVITESEVLHRREVSRLPEMDHQSRNYLLRCATIDRLDLPEEFIMADDDSRPLRRLGLDFFKSSGKYVGYWFYRMARWPSAVTAFDIGQINTCKLLTRLGADTLSYASHMPQIIQRDLYREIASMVRTETACEALCEWSTYFNLAWQRHRGRFHPPANYQTLVWPEHPGAWTMDVFPQDYAFENLNPVLYRRNGLFADLVNPDDVAAAGVEKIDRWRRFSTGYLSGQNSFRQDAALDGVLRTIVYRLLRPWRKVGIDTKPGPQSRDRRSP